MKSETIYNRLICVDALLSFDGIVPSLPDLQLKAIALVELLSKALIAEGECEQLSDDLCHTLCCYLDRQIAFCLRADGIAWDRYSLTRYFYGYQSEKETLRDRLERLLAHAEGQIFSYARKLLLLAAASSGSGHDLEKLRALYAPPSPVADWPEEETLMRTATEYGKPVRFMLPFQLVLLSLPPIALWFFCISYLEAF